MYDGVELYLCSICMVLWRTQGFYRSVDGVRIGCRLDGSVFNSQLGQVIASSSLQSWRPTLRATLLPAQWVPGVVPSVRVVAGHYSSLPAPNLQPTANQERNDQCGNQKHIRELLMMGIVVPETC